MQISIKSIYFFKAASLLTTAMLLLLYACQQPNNTGQGSQTAIDSLAHLQNGLKRVDSIAILIKPGDLVLRRGNDFTSESLRQLNQRNKTYSHCGIASIEQGQIYIYHALGGEFNPDQKIRRDPLPQFANPADNRGMAVYRYKAPEMYNGLLADKAAQMHQAGIQFDMQFDLASNDRMYCAEFVYKALLLASNGKLKCHISHIGQFAFVGVDDLFLHPYCGRLTEITYK